MTTSNRWARPIIALALACAALLLAPPINIGARAAPVFVNATALREATPGTSLASTAFAATTGNAIIAASRSSTPVSTVTDTAGNKYHRVPPPPISLDATYAEMWYASNITGHVSNQVTFTWVASSVSRHVATIQFSGVANQSPLDQASFNTTGASSTLATQDKITTSVADGVLVMYCQMNATSATDWKASSGFTVAAQDANKVTMIAYDLYTSIQSGVSPSCTHADGGGKSIIVGAFSASVGGGGGESIIGLFSPFKSLLPRTRGE